MAIVDHKKYAMRFFSVRYLLVAILVVAGLGMWSYPSCRHRVIGTLVECHSTGTYGVGDILLRAKSPESEVLLIGPISSSASNSIRLAGAPMIPTGHVYRYDPALARLESCGLDEWEEATGIIAYRYFDRDQIAKTPMKRDIQTDSLSFDGVPIRTAGPYVIEIGVSPDGSIANVISANAQRTPGNWWLGGGYPRGPYYHETLERTTGKKIGGTYTLKDPEPLGLSFCWEAQGKYIVYHDGYGKFLWIVPGPNLSSSESALQHESPAREKQEKNDD